MSDLTRTQQLISEECDRIKTMLIEKNRAYGDSAIAPVRVFSKADSVEQLKVRLDDKLSRIMRGEAAGEDVEQDLVGYIVLLRVARRLAAAAPVQTALPLDPPVEPAKAKGKGGRPRNVYTPSEEALIRSMLATGATLYAVVKAINDGRGGKHAVSWSGIKNHCRRNGLL